MWTIPLLIDVLALGALIAVAAERWSRSRARPGWFWWVSLFGVLTVLALQAAYLMGGGHHG